MNRRTPGLFVTDGARVRLFPAHAGPLRSDDARARRLAVGAKDVRGGARVAASLGEAVADCSWVVGTSGRVRLRPSPMDPEAFAAEAARRPGRVALVFGDERTGLRRDELARWHALTLHPDRCPATLAQPGPGHLRRERKPISTGSRPCSRTSSAPSVSSVRARPARVPGRSLAEVRIDPRRGPHLGGSHPHGRPLAQENSKDDTGLKPNQHS